MSIAAGQRDPKIRARTLLLALTGLHDADLAVVLPRGVEAVVSRIDLLGSDDLAGRREDRQLLHRALGERSGPGHGERPILDQDVVAILEFDDDVASIREVCRASHADGLATDGDRSDLRHTVRIQVRKGHRGHLDPFAAKGPELPVSRFFARIAAAAQQAT